MSFYINLSNIYRSAEEKLQQGSIKKRAEIIQLEVIFLFILTTYIPLRWMPEPFLASYLLRHLFWNTPLLLR